MGGYRILAPLGSGGMGTVYRAVDGGGSPVALKLLHPHIGADPVGRDRLRREVAALQRLRHPGVAAVLDAEADSTEAFVVTELVDGLTLEEHVRRGGPLPPAELADLAAGLRDALRAVHSAGVVHRDLKPTNVMVTPAGPVLIDFGIAQAADEVRVTSTGFVVGTPGYLAPELLADGDPSPGTDWWGWAAVLAFAATGRAPFGTRPLDAVIARTRAGDVDLAGVDPAVAAPLRAALRPEPDGRAVPDDVVDGLDGAAGAVPPAPPTQVLTAGAGGAGTVPTRAAGSTAVPMPADDATAATRAVPVPADDGTAATRALHPGDGTAPTRAVTAVGPGTAPTRAVPPVSPVVAAGAMAAVPQDGFTRALPVARAADTAATAAIGRDGPRPPSVVPAAAAGYRDAGDDEPPGPTGAGADGAGARADVPGAPADPDPDPYVPPRPRRRAGTVLALGLAVVAGAMLYPGVALLVVAAALVLFRTAGSAGEAMDRRRERRGGAARGDTARAVAASPWHVLRALVGLLPSVLVAASVVVVVGGVLWWALQTGRLVVSAASTGPDGGNGPLAYCGVLGLAVLLGVVTAWFGPLSALTRVGARRVLAAVAPGWSGAAVLVALALAVAGVLLVLLATGQDVVWWPLPGPPSLR